MAQFNPLEIVMCGDKRQYYTYDGELYTGTFPQEWVKSHSSDGTGPKECINCNIVGSWNGVFIGYCSNCAEVVYKFERGNGFYIMGIEKCINDNDKNAFKSYLKNIDLKDIGDVDLISSINVIDKNLQRHVAKYFESSIYRKKYCTDENTGKQSLILGINNSEIIKKIFHITETYAINYDKTSVFINITVYHDTMIILEKKMDEITHNEGLDINIDTENSLNLQQEQNDEEEEEKEIKIQYEIYRGEEYEKYMRGIDVGEYSIVVNTKFMTLEEFKIKFQREKRETELQYDLFCKEEYEIFKKKQDAMEQAKDDEMFILYQAYCDDMCENYKEERRTCCGERIINYEFISFEDFKINEEIKEHYKDYQEDCEENECPDEYPFNESGFYGSNCNGGYDSN